ncbi:hypothetical protein RJ640_017988 [Escallonia rubra]|uniref:Toprim domain-containing protein n=1 Tax=Escallonia rubra TaxID=112253 RepID=A0AA88S0I5_9ASTE|nr:hypothetical protein RJ640_017988 [Escallonia rubra]
MLRLPQHISRPTNYHYSATPWFQNSNLFFANPTQRMSRILPFSINYVSRSAFRANAFNPPENHVENEEGAKFRVLKRTLDAIGIECTHCAPGHYSNLFCPKCKGGQSIERSLSFHINQNMNFAMWRCFRFECGWAGKADIGAAHDGVNENNKVNSTRQMTEESLGLEPLGDKLIAYFAERMISKDVLQKNFVLQTSADQNAIAFTYRRNGVLVNCKYRSVLNKKFWQKHPKFISPHILGPFRNGLPSLVGYSVDELENLLLREPYLDWTVWHETGFPIRSWPTLVDADCYGLITCRPPMPINGDGKEKGAEKILYGLDNIKSVDELIIVEGEIDKLSMEQAGLLNCVSVPDGAPQKVSAKELPSLEKDTRFPYLWNCKEYLDKASRIILATDSDIPGQALAEELARRLGRERCWLVSWPKKDEYSYFKDANEVLKNLGAGTLRDTVGNAKPYQVQNN